MLKLSADIEDAEEVGIAMTADSRFVPFPTTMLTQMRASEDDVPPRAGFQIIDRDKPESLDQLPPVDQIPEAAAMVFVYGKQTDRSARIEVHDVRGSDVAEVRDRLTATAGDIDLQQEDGDPLPLLVACQPPVAMLRFQAKPADAEILQAELAAQRMPNAIVNLKLPILGGNSLAELAEDESKLLDRTSVVRLIEQYDTMTSKSEHLVKDVCELANVPMLPPIKPGNQEIESIPNEDLGRVDPSDLDAQSLIYLLQRAQQISATFAVRSFASQLIDSELNEAQRPAKLLAYSALINASSTTTDALATLEQAKKFADDNKMSSANLLLSEVSLRLQAGDGEGFQKALETISTRYGSEPEVLAQLQQLLMAYGLIRPDGSTRPAPQVEAGEAMGAGIGGEPAPAPAAGSTLWTPDGGAPVAPQDAGGTGKKLWIPGMD